MRRKKKIAEEPVEEPGFDTPPNQPEPPDDSDFLGDDPE